MSAAAAAYDLAGALRRWRALASALPAAAADPDPCGPANLVWLCDTALAELGRYPDDKIGRWLGFVQGVLAARGLAVPDAAACPPAACSPASGGGAAPTAVAEPPPGTLAWASALLLRRYAERAADALAPGEVHGPVSPGGVVWLCADARARLDRLSAAEQGLRVGYIQGVLCRLGLASVGEERDFSRPLFHAVYRAQGGEPPPTRERTG